MSRFLAVACVALAVVAPARADRIAPIATPAERALRTPIVVVGKVTAIEKDTVEAPIYPGGAKVAHKIAVVKVETNLLGAANTTHLKVGFAPSASERAAGIRPGRGLANPELKEGQEWLFFLTKHHGGEFHAIPYLTPPVESKAGDYKAQLDEVKKVLAITADPVKALKAEKADDRAFAAIVLVTKYRVRGEAPEEHTEVAVDKDESKLILKALSEGDWKPDRLGGRLNVLSAFYALVLTDKDGWTAPMAKAGEDFTTAMRTAFVKWLEGSGKDYQIKKVVPKKK